ncbi:replication protein A 70 kDa DNA-binding subunit E [Trifolium repens]|nr:replication protein A 70 kDa DNA-binding subunit E [Trifolium repens]
MDSAFDLLGAVTPGKDSWRFKVRVLRLWNTYSFLKPDVVNSLEMVLIDEKGSKIHASIRRQLLYLFRDKIFEGKVYKMSHFTVGPESGLYRTTDHPYKLIFEMKTKVQLSESKKIDEYGLSLSTIGAVKGYGAGHDFLVGFSGVRRDRCPTRTTQYFDRSHRASMIHMLNIVFATHVGSWTKIFGDSKPFQKDEVKNVQERCANMTLEHIEANVVALVTPTSPEKEYVRDGKVTKMVVLQIIDNRMLANAGGSLPVLVIQFAKIKDFRGNVSIQNVLNATRIYINPSMPEADAFKEGLSIVGIVLSTALPTVSVNARPSLEEDFLLKYPKTSISDLLDINKDGIYVVGGIVDGLVDPEDWWYTACSCHRSVSADSGAYYCHHCVKHVFRMVPRFRLKLRVSDGSGQAVFVLFDGDVNFLLEKHCHELVSVPKSKNAGYYPPELELLKGMKLLFKVEKSPRIGSILFDGSFRVKRVCSDMSIIDAFDSDFLNENSDSDSDDDDDETIGTSVPHLWHLAYSIAISLSPIAFGSRYFAEKN